MLCIETVYARTVNATYLPNQDLQKQSTNSKICGMVLFMVKKKRHLLKWHSWFILLFLPYQKITQDMKQSLADLGYSKQEIGNLKPAYAQLVRVINIIAYSRF